jgi:hypothetical protein
MKSGERRSVKTVEVEQLSSRVPWPFRAGLALCVRCGGRAKSWPRCGVGVAASGSCPAKHRPNFPTSTPYHSRAQPAARTLLLCDGRLEVTPPGTWRGPRRNCSTPANPVQNCASHTR